MQRDRQFCVYKMFVPMLMVALAAFFLPQSAWAEEGDLTIGQMRANAIETQAAPYNAKTSDGFVLIKGIKSGHAYYNKKTKTLELESLRATAITLQKAGRLTIALKGKNKVDIESEYGVSSSVVIQGKGSLSGPIEIDGDLTIKSGRIVAKGKGHILANGIRCDDFLMTGGSVKATEASDMAQAIQCDGRFTMEGGVLTAIATGSDKDDDSCEGIACEGNFTMRGGTLTAIGNGAESATGIDCGYGSFVMTSGTLKATGKGRTGGSLVDGIKCLFGNATISGGKVIATASGNDSAFGFSCDGKFTMKGGALVTSGKGKYGLSLGLDADSILVSKGVIKASASSVRDHALGITCNRTFKMKGGSVSVSNVKSTTESQESTAVKCVDLIAEGGKLKVSNSQGSGILCTSMTIKKGTVAVDNQNKGEGVRVYGGRLKMTGGTLKVTRSHEDAIHVESYYSDDDKRDNPETFHRGTAIINGGKVTAMVRYPSAYYAIRVDDYFAYKKSCLKSIRGMLP